ncbi:MAG: signal peptide peptidase SppA [Nitrospirota bacterium]
MTRGHKLLIIGGVLAFLVLSAAAVAGGIYLLRGEGLRLADERIALITVDDVILNARPVVDQIRRFDRDGSVKAIVIRLDTPGGGVVPSQEIYEAVRGIEKPVVVSMGSVAASGGYYIACAADKVLANPGTLTGSIGVIMEFANVEGLLSKIGVKSTVVKSGEHKDIGSPTREITPEEKRILSRVIDDVHSQFVEAIVKGRKLPEADVRALADGRIFTGRQALDLKLVDGLATLQEAIKEAGEMGGIEGEPRVIEEKKEVTFFNLLSGTFLGRLISHPAGHKIVNLQYIASF